MSDDTIVDAEHRALAIVDDSARGANVALFGTEEPDEVIEKAVKVADALKKVITQKNLVKKIQGREHVEIAGWQTLGAMTGVFAIPEWTRKMDDGSGYEARVIVQKNGVTIGAAEAQCSRSESTWKQRDDYALKSMAQTRAASKALRGVLGFIVVLAGYSDTPADEMPESPSREPAPVITQPDSSKPDFTVEHEKRLLWGRLKNEAEKLAPQTAAALIEQATEGRAVSLGTIRSMEDARLVLEEFQAYHAGLDQEIPL